MAIRPMRNIVCEENYPVVSTNKGKVRGYVDDGIFCFRGIPYAKAKRFRMPEAVADWEGVKDAFNYGTACPLMTYSLEGWHAENELMGIRRTPYFSEDCQNLNVWSPTINPDTRKPVMVWFHGGGFAGGSSTELYSYDGWELSRFGDVVVVTVNHRLNMIGFMDLSEYGEQYKYSGNAGIADLVAALRWVRDNIKNFGGDPDNVTIFGQSGGGGKITTLMQTPSADGLYHKAIIQSGVLAGGRKRVDSPEMVSRMLELLDISRESIEQIESIPYETLAKALKQAVAETNGNLLDWNPKEDGEFYLGSFDRVGFRRETAGVPVIVGTNLAEFDPIPSGRKDYWSNEKKNQLLRDKYAESFETVKDAFTATYPKLDYSYAVCVDTYFRRATINFVQKRIEMTDAPVYQYMFTFETPLFGGQLPGHSGELPFMFHNACYTEFACKPGVSERLQDEMAGAWAAFAWTGQPNAPQLPHWHPVTSSESVCMMFGDTTGECNLDDGRLLALVESNRKYPG